MPSPRTFKAQLSTSSKVLFEFRYQVEDTVKCICSELSPKLLTATPIFTNAYEDTEGEMSFNSHFEIEEVVELTFEDWKLPPSIEDEETTASSKPLGSVLEEARGARDCPMRSNTSLVRDGKLILYPSLCPELAAQSPPLRNTSCEVVIRQQPSKSRNSYLPSPKSTPLPRPIRSFSRLDERPQSDRENHSKPLNNLSINVNLTGFPSPTAVVDTNVSRRHCLAPKVSSPEQLFHPRHFRRPSFSNSPICVTELAQLREGLWDLQVTEHSGDIGEDSLDNEATGDG